MLSEETAILPDTAEIRRDLEFMTARWQELGIPVKFEIRAFKENAQPHTARFSPDWIDDAVDWCENMNSLGFNIYAVRNPIRGDISGSASDTDIVAAFFLWADCDDLASAGNVYRFDGPKWTAAVTTGRTPSVRVHVYWQLEKPCTDLAQWRSMQETIAAHFGSDKTVVNPSRIMRVGGTVSYPAKRKQERGYIKEVTTVRTEYPNETRHPVTLDQMRRVFGASRATDHATPHIAVNAAGPSLDRQQAQQSAMSGEEWHKNIVKLTGSYVSKGLSDAEIHAITDGMTLAGYTVDQTRREVQKAIDGARGKGWTPEPKDEQVRELTQEERDAIPAALFRPWVQKDLSQIPYPEFVYSDFYARGYTSVTLAPPKVGKSMLGLAEAIDIATGRGFLTGVEREPQRVVYYNAEDDQNVIDSRVAALLEHYNIDQNEIVGRLYAQSGVELDNFYMVSGQEGVINEALFVSIEKFIAETGASALVFDPLQDLSRSPETNEVFRLLGQRIRRMAAGSNVAVGLIHHTRKIAPGATATIEDGRGGSALRGTARFNRLLTGMTEDEGAKAGVDNHRHYLRIGDIESNLAPPSSDVNRWFQKISVKIPNGHYIGAIAPWKWPDAFDGVGRHDAARVRAVIDGMEEPPRADVRSAAWAGNIVANVLGLNLSNASDKARVKSIISQWVAKDVLRISEGRDPRAGRATNIIICGANDPLTEVNE